MDPAEPHPAQPDDRHDRGCGSKRHRRWPRHDRSVRHRRSWPARCLDQLQRSCQRRRASGQRRPGGLRVSDTARPGPGRITRAGHLPSQPRHPGRRELPARQPLLAPPVRRDRALPGPRPGPGLVLLLAAQPPPLLTSGKATGGEPEPDSDGRRERTGERRPMETAEGGRRGKISAGQRETGGKPVGNPEDVR